MTSLVKKDAVDVLGALVFRGMNQIVLHLRSGMESQFI
jgi:hypothetical protein